MQMDSSEVLRAMKPISAEQNVGKKIETLFRPPNKHETQKEKRTTLGRTLELLRV